ncbi:MAG: cytochrome c maturation protein CcmE [Abditibacteriaceae bacterium]
MKNGSFRYIAGISVILIAFALLVMGSMRSNTLRAMPVDQLVGADGQSMVGQRLRIAGFVGSAPVTKTDVQTPQGTHEIKHFNVVYHGKTVAVTFQDALPDMFKAGLPVQVEGVYTAPGKMKADQVLTKCPSKYQAEEAQNALKQERKSKLLKKASSTTKY